MFETARILALEAYEEALRVIDEQEESCSGLTFEVTDVNGKVIRGIGSLADTDDAVRINADLQADEDGEYYYLVWQEEYGAYGSTGIYFIDSADRIILLECDVEMGREVLSLNGRVYYEGVE